MKFSRVLILFVLVLSLSCSTGGVDDIVTKNLVARGGFDNWKKINSMEFAFFIQTQGIEMPIIVSKKGLDKLCMVMGSGAMGLTTIINGNEGWRIMLPKIDTLVGDELAQSKFQLITQYLAVDPILYSYKERGFKLSQDGIEKDGKNEFYKITGSDKSNNKFTVYVDKTTLLDKRVDTQVESNKKMRTLSVYLEDYKMFEGVQIPYSLNIKLDGEDIGKIILKDVKFNALQNDSLFTKPALDSNLLNNEFHKMHGM